MIYRDYIIEYDPLPIPIYTMDWSYCHKDYDGPGDNRHGRAKDEESAKHEVDLLLEDCLHDVCWTVLGGVGAISPELYGRTLDEIARLVGRVNDTQFKCEVIDVLATFPCPLD